MALFQGFLHGFIARRIAIVTVGNSIVSNVNVSMNRSFFF